MNNLMYQLDVIDMKVMRNWKSQNTDVDLVEEAAGKSRQRCLGRVQRRNEANVGGFERNTEKQYLALDVVKWGSIVRY